MPGRRAEKATGLSRRGPGPVKTKTGFAAHRGGATTGESHTEGEWGGERRRGGSASDARGSSMTRCTRKGGVHFPAAAVRLDASVRGAKERHHMSPVHLFFWSSLSDSLRATWSGMASGSLTCSSR